jgi:hypothetical protein
VGIVSPRQGCPAEAIVPVTHHNGEGLNPIAHAHAGRTKKRGPSSLRNPFKMQIKRETYIIYSILLIR